MFLSEKESARRELLEVAKLIGDDKTEDLTTIQMFAAAVVDYLQADKPSMADRLAAIAERDGVVITPGMGAREYAEAKIAAATDRLRAAETATTGLTPEQIVERGIIPPEAGLVQ